MNFCGKILNDLHVFSVMRCAVETVQSVTRFSLKYLLQLYSSGGDDDKLGHRLYCHFLSQLYNSLPLNELLIKLMNHCHLCSSTHQNIIHLCLASSNIQGAIYA